MGFLDWLSKRNRKNERERLRKKRVILDDIERWANDVRSRKGFDLDLQYKLSPKDARILSGEDHYLHTFFDWPLKYGKVRIHVAPIADKWIPENLIGYERTDDREGTETN